MVRGTGQIPDPVAGESRPHRDPADRLLHRDRRPGIRRLRAHRTGQPRHAAGRPAARRTQRMVDRACGAARPRTGRGGDLPPPRTRGSGDHRRRSHVRRTRRHLRERKSPVARCPHGSLPRPCGHLHRFPRCRGRDLAGLAFHPQFRLRTQIRPRRRDRRPGRTAPAASKDRGRRSPHRGGYDRAQCDPASHCGTCEDRRSSRRRTKHRRVHRIGHAGPRGGIGSIRRRRGGCGLMNLITSVASGGTASLSLLALQNGTAGGDSGNDATWLAIGLGLGFLALMLFAVEIFIPTAGMVGILCGICAIASIVAFFQHSSSAGGFAILVYLVATPFLLVYGVKLWSHSPIGRRLILGGTDTVDGRGLDDQEVEDRVEAMAASSRRNDDAMIGRMATTATPLRPVGIIRFEGRRLDALSEAGIIEEGVEVEIVAVVDNQIKVRVPGPSDHATD
ncbi:MAG: hypothetical protein CMJ34_03650 [Phycisphaerae bacterium]|nr:hypothetical protein [Phycisphaerae bacterium]